MTDDATDDIDPYGGWSDELSKGDLRRLQFHLAEAQDRLWKAHDILDDAGLIDAWYEMPDETGLSGGDGFIYDVTDAVSRLSSSATEARNEYDDRRGN